VVVSSYAPDVLWESEDGITSADGGAAVRGLWEEWSGTFEDFMIDVESVVDLGNGVVYAVYREQGRIAGGNALLVQHGALVYEWANGMITRVMARADTDEARAAAQRLAESRE